MMASTQCYVLSLIASQVAFCEVIIFVGFLGQKPKIINLNTVSLPLQLISVVISTNISCKLCFKSTNCFDANFALYLSVHPNPLSTLQQFTNSERGATKQALLREQIKFH